MASVRMSSDLCRAGLTVASTSEKWFAVLALLFLAPLIGKFWGFDGAEADDFILQNAASQEAFNGGLLVGGEILGVANHGTETDYMTD